MSYPYLPYRDADGHHSHVRRAAPDVHAAIVRASVPTTPYGARHKSDARSGAPASVTLVWIPIPRIQSSALHAFWTARVLWTQLGDVS